MYKGNAAVVTWFGAFCLGLVIWKLWRGKKEVKEFIEVGKLGKGR